MPKVFVVLALVLATHLYALPALVPRQPAPDSSLPRYDVTVSGAKCDGVTDDTAAIQATIDSIERRGQAAVLLLPPSRTCYVSQEIEVRADNLVVWAVNSTVLGPVEGTKNGGVVTVVDRRNPLRQVVNVGIYGLTVKTRNAHDNGLSASGVKKLAFSAVTVDMTSGGLRAFTLQSRPTLAPVNDVLITDCQATGGTNGLDIESTGADNLIDGVTVIDCTFTGSLTPIRVSAGGSSYAVNRIYLSNITAQPGATPAGGDTVTVFNTKNSRLSYITLSGIAPGAIGFTFHNNSNFSADHLNAIAGSSAGRYCMEFVGGTGGFISNFECNGAGVPSFDAAIYMASQNYVLHDGLIRNASQAFYTVGDNFHTVYDTINVVVPTVTGPSQIWNVVRSADTRKNIVVRTGS